VQEKRDNFIDGLENIDPRDIIVIDEAGTDLTMAAEYARAEGGERIKAPKHFKAKGFSPYFGESLPFIINNMACRHCIKQLKISRGTADYNLSNHCTLSRIIITYRLIIY
jgi:hypothetical protein